MGGMASSLNSIAERERERSAARGGEVPAKPLRNAPAPLVQTAAPPQPMVAGRTEAQQRNAVPALGVPGLVR
jgi:hypothetical protein